MEFEVRFVLSSQNALKTANDAVDGAVQRRRYVTISVHAGVQLYVQPQHSAAFATPISVKLTDAEQRYVHSCYTEFQQTWTIIMEISGRNSLSSLRYRRFFTAPTFMKLFSFISRNSGPPPPAGHGLLIL